MPKTIGLIPERRRIIAIGRVYAYVKKEIIRENAENEFDEIF